jgi:hypothetical protein
LNINKACAASTLQKGGRRNPSALFLFGINPVLKARLSKRYRRQNCKRLHHL